MTGNSSNTRSLSDLVSNILEAIANCERSGFEVISGEDNLAKKEEANKVAELIEEK